MWIKEASTFGRFAVARLARIFALQMRDPLAAQPQALMKAGQDCLCQSQGAAVADGQESFDALFLTDDQFFRPAHVPLFELEIGFGHDRGFSIVSGDAPPPGNPP
jgi:hypothetical protein